MEEEKKKKSFMMFYDWEPLFVFLDDEDVGALFKALFAYEIRNEWPKHEDLDDSVWGVFKYLAARLDENRKHWESKSNAGNLGGKKSGETRRNKAKATTNQNEADAKQNEADAKQNEADAKQNEHKDKDKDKDKDKVSPKGDIESVGAFSSKPTPTRKIIPPKPEWVSKYFNDQGFTSDPSAFFDYWESRGWKTKTGMMKDWEAAARTWNRNEGQFSTPRNTPQTQTQNSTTDWDKIAKEVEQLGYFNDVNNHADVFAGIPATVREDVGG